ncbi:MAG TPA: DM13 domain-containing protein [Candidatus Aquilonibacter sp.]|nr:DM13 domain-containing protein [Candidatus Aquilonibacter sp.]
MDSYVRSWVSRRRWLLVAVGLAVLIGAWWAFRPEKLWINKEVNEPAPFASSTDPQPVYTGLLEGKAHQTSGRATIYKTTDGKEYLRLTDLSTSNGPDVHVLLARSDDESLKQEIVKGQLDSIELGPLKGNQGDQNYDLPASVDLQKYDAAVIYCERFHAVFGVGKLEQF